MHLNGKKVIGFILSLPILAVYVYGFTHFRPMDILIPASFASAGGFVILGALWLFRYSGSRKEANRS